MQKFPDDIAIHRLLAALILNAPIDVEMPERTTVLKADGERNYRLILEDIRTGVSVSDLVHLPAEHVEAARDIVVILREFSDRVTEERKAQGWTTKH